MKFEESNALFEESRNYFPGGVNSPVRAFGSVGGAPVFVKRASGSHIFDEDGNEYHHDHDGEFVEDYMKAISAYRKTFPKKDDVIENTPNPAVK